MERGKQENRLPQERPENIYQREKEKGKHKALKRIQL